MTFCGAGYCDRGHKTGAVPGLAGGFNYLIRIGIIRIIDTRRRAIIVHYDPPAGRIQIVELAAAGRPEKCCDGRSEKQQAERDQDEYDAHVASPMAGLPGFAMRVVESGVRTTPLLPSRSAFSMTSSELSDIPSAAIHGASRPNAASGIAVRL